MNEANVTIVEQTLKHFIKESAVAHAEKYVERHRKVAYDSYLAGMMKMAEIMEDKK